MGKPSLNLPEAVELPGSWDAASGLTPCYTAKLSIQRTVICRCPAPSITHTTFLMPGHWTGAQLGAFLSMKPSPSSEPVKYHAEKAAARPSPPP